jgi:hypothetical protein
MTRVDPHRYPLRLTDREGTPAMRTHRALLVSGALALLASSASMIVHGDWQAALTAFAGPAAGAFLVSLTRLLAIGDRLALPARPPAAAASGGEPLRLARRHGRRGA